MKGMEQFDISQLALQAKHEQKLDGKAAKDVRNQATELDVIKVPDPDMARGVMVKVSLKEPSPRDLLEMDMMRPIAHLG